MISVSTLGVNTNHPNLYMYDQCKYSVGVNTNHQTSTCMISLSTVV